MAAVVNPDARHYRPEDRQFAANLQQLRINDNLSLRDVEVLTSEAGHPMTYSAIHRIEACRRTVSIGESLTLCTVLRTDVVTMTTTVIPPTRPPRPSTPDLAAAQRNGMAPDTILIRT